MMVRKAPPVAAFSMLLVLALATVGVGYGLWSKILFIEGTVNTGDVNAEYVEAFTDDDNKLDDVTKDFNDDDSCSIGSGSCDPRESDEEDANDADHRYDKGVAECFASLAGVDPDPDQEGNQGAAVEIDHAYPSYHCNAWFTIKNNGSIPILLHSVKIQGVAAGLCPNGQEYDLGGDAANDVEICVSGWPEGELQIDPFSWFEETFQFDLDIHVLQDAPQGAELEFDAEVCLHQWNEETGNCPEPTT